MAEQHDATCDTPPTMVIAPIFYRIVSSIIMDVAAIGRLRNLLNSQYQSALRVGSVIIETRPREMVIAHFAQSVLDDRYRVYWTIGTYTGLVSFNHFVRLIHPAVISSFRLGPTQPRDMSISGDTESDDDASLQPEWRCHMYIVLAAPRVIAHLCNDDPDREAGNRTIDGVQMHNKQSHPTDGAYWANTARFNHTHMWEESHDAMTQAKRERQRQYEVTTRPSSNI
jgi:hypothetical protein